MPLKVLSYNIREGGEGRLPLLAHVIQAQQPDAVALLEVNSQTNVEALAHLLQTPCVFGEANSPYHVAWLTRLPVQRWHNHRLPTLSKTLLEIEVAWEGQTLNLFAAHLASRHDAHLPVEEVTVILEVLRPLAHQPHVLVSDFNALSPGDPIGAPPPGTKWRGDAANAPRQAIQKLLDAGYIDCYRAAHPRSPGYTYSSTHPWLRLDYIFAPPLMAPRLQACNIVYGDAAEQASDHLPIWAQFHLTEEIALNYC